MDEVALPTDGSLDAVIIALAYHDLWLTDEDRTKLFEGNAIKVYPRLKNYLK